MELVKLMLWTHLKTQANQNKTLSAVQKGQSNDNAQIILWFNKEKKVSSRNSKVVKKWTKTERGRKVFSGLQNQYVL